MVKFDLKRMQDMSNSVEIYRIAECICVTFESSPEIRVEIREYPNQQYKGIPNFSFWGVRQANPYHSSKPYDSPIDALDDAIQGLLCFKSDEYENEEIVWYKSKDSQSSYEDGLFIDGNGKRISYEEFLKRKQKYKEKYKEK